MSNSVEFLTVLDRGKVQVGQVNQVYLMLTLKGNSLELQNRVPLNISFVVDCSGSMSGEKMEHTRQALGICLSSLESQDLQSMVVFDHEVEVLMPAGPVANKDLAKQLVKRIEARGSTNLSGGLLQGVKLVEENLAADKVNRVIMLTDGRANEGISDYAGLVKIAGKIAKKGMGLSCIGVGDDFDEDLLTAMAEAGRGNFYYIDNPDNIPAIFAEELQGLLQVVGQGLQLEIKLEEGLYVPTVYGYEPTSQPGGLTFSLPDLYSGEEKLLMLELEIPPLDKGWHRLMHLRLNYLDGEQQEDIELTVPIDIWVGEEADLSEQSPDPEVEKNLRLFQISEVQKRAIELADENHFEQAQEVLQQFLDNCPTAMDDELMKSVNELKSNYDAMSSATYDRKTRKDMQYSSYQTSKNRRERR
jgi:Ca-activated chloride channel family protein